MSVTYEDLLTCNIYEAIKFIGADRREFKTAKEWLHSDDNNPAKIPNNPLLTDYNWVYDHAEELFCQNKLYYQQFQPTEAYYTLFKALINKYPIDSDYNEMLFNNRPSLKYKWKYFANNLVEFMAYSFDHRVKDFLAKPGVMEYFLKYPAIYDVNTLSIFSHEGLEVFLKTPAVAKHYKSNYSDLIYLARQNPKLTIPKEIMLDSKFIKDLSRTSHIEEFYYYLNFVSENVCDQPFLDEHSAYCDKEIASIKNNILPCYEEQYQNYDENIDINELSYFNFMDEQVVERIFKRSNKTSLPKEYVFQELSKYMIIGMFISRNYQTDPYNLLIDIETLYEFAQKEGRTLTGQDIYDFLLSFEDKSIDEVLKFYELGKTLPLMDMLYDDWNNEHENFINELNKNIYIPKKEAAITKDNITYYDITNITEPIIVHNTAVALDNKQKITETINRIKTGQKYCLSLSVQDQDHNTYYTEGYTRDTKTLKLAFGPLNPTKVGTVCHTDAYSQGKRTIEIENLEYKRRLYTLKSFMEQTTNYNEVVYSICGEPFLPIGIICEDEITKEEQAIAEELNVPILYRKTKESTLKPYVQANLPKRYTYTREKYMF